MDGDRKTDDGPQKDSDQKYQISYEDLIHSFLHKFSYNIPKQVYFKGLCKIKQLPNQSIKDFVKV